MNKLIKGDNRIINATIEFLNEQIKTDEQLRAAIDKEEKTIEKLWRYIETKAKKVLNNKNGGIEKSEVYGWAIHYFIESEETINEELGLNKQKSTRVQTKTTKQKEQVKPALEALSIFDFLGDQE